MGLLDSFANTSSSGYIFKTREEIKKALFGIKTLTQKERDDVYRKISAELDDGGVTPYEGKEKLNHIFYEMYKEGKISSVDLDKLKDLWE